MLKRITTIVAFIVAALILSVQSGAQEAKPQEEAKKQANPLGSHETGVDVLALRQKELRVFEDFVSKYPVPPIPDSERVVINREVWQARAIILEQLKSFNSTEDDAKTPGLMPSHSQWQKAPDASKKRSLSPIASAITNYRNSLERPVTDEEREILDAAEENIIDIVKNPKIKDYYTPDKKSFISSIDYFVDASFLLSMLVGQYPFDDEKAQRKRSSRHKGTVKKLIGSIELRQIEGVSLWARNGEDSPFYFPGEVRTISQSTVQSLIATSAKVVLALFEAQQAGYTVSTTVLEAALAFSQENAVPMEYKVPKYFTPPPGKVEDAKSDETELVEALGWYAGVVPVETLDPKKLLTKDQRESYRAKMLSQKSRANNFMDQGEFAILLLTCKMLEKKKSGKDGKEQIWPAIARMIASLNPELALGKDPERIGATYQFGHQKCTLDLDIGIGFTTFTMLLGRERYGRIDWYKENTRPLLSVCAHGESVKHATVEAPPVGSNVFQRAGYAANVLESCASLLENVFYQPIGKEGVPESGKEGSKPISGGAKPAEGDDKAPEKPEGDSKPKGEDKATKQD